MWNCNIDIILAGVYFLRFIERFTGIFINICITFIRDLPEVDFKQTHTTLTRLELLTSRFHVAFNEIQWRIGIPLPVVRMNHPLVTSLFS